MAIIIKPHHYIDMLKLYGSGLNQFVPDMEYRHAFYSVGNAILNYPDIDLQFTLECDDICSPCKFKDEQGICQDTVDGLSGYVSKDAYNKMIDRCLIDLLGLNLERTYTSKDFCEFLCAHKKVIFDVWTIENPAVTERRYELFCKGCERYLQKVTSWRLAMQTHVDL